MIGAVIARSIRVARAASSTTSIVVLLAVNLLPLAGVLFWHWNVATLLVLYWVENGIVGLYNIPKMLLASGTAAESGVTVTGPLAADGAGSRIGLVLFFLIHYGIFWLVHGVFVFALSSFAALGGGVPGQAIPGGVLDPAAGDLPSFGGSGNLDVYVPTGPDLGAVAFAAVGLAISHGVSFAVNFLGRREYLHVTPARQMVAPYGRLVILHLTILFGAFVSMAIGSPVGAIVVLVLLKTGLDLALHLREHDRAAGVRPA